MIQKKKPLIITLVSLAFFIYLLTAIPVKRLGFECETPFGYEKILELKKYIVSKNNYPYDFFPLTFMKYQLYEYRGIQYRADCSNFALGEIECTIYKDKKEKMKAYKGFKNGYPRTVVYEFKQHTSPVQDATLFTRRYEINKDTLNEEEVYKSRTGYDCKKVDIWLN